MMAAQTQINTFRIVHPLYDEPEAKRNPADLGPMKLSKSVRISLLTLRAYLICMAGLLAYRMLVLSGLFQHLHRH